MLYPENWRAIWSITSVMGGVVRQRSKPFTSSRAVPHGGATKATIPRSCGNGRKRRKRRRLGFGPAATPRYLGNEGFAEEARCVGVVINAKHQLPSPRDRHRGTTCSIAEGVRGRKVGLSVCYEVWSSARTAQRQPRCRSWTPCVPAIPYRDPSPGSRSRGPHRTVARSRATFGN
jgi:hypothetical protein